MSSADAQRFLDASQEVLDDYVTWEGSPDAGEWHADGSHQPERIQGDYYAYDRPRAVGQERSAAELLAEHRRVRYTIFNEASGTTSIWAHLSGLFQRWSDHTFRLALTDPEVHQHGLNPSAPVDFRALTVTMYRIEHMFRTQLEIHGGAARVRVLIDDDMMQAVPWDWFLDALSAIFTPEVWERGLEPEQATIDLAERWHRYQADQRRMQAERVIRMSNLGYHTPDTARRLLGGLG